MKAETPSFRQGVPESSAREGNFSDTQVFDLGNAAGHSLPSGRWISASAEMTGIQDLCITPGTRAWEPSKAAPCK